MATLTVGPGQEYPTLTAAVAASQNGDVIQVQAGTYTNDFPAAVTDNITIEGVGGLANFVATESPPNEKGILVIGNGTDSPAVTLDELEFSGAAISNAEGGNAAGVRYQSGDLTIDNSDFHNNQDGLLADPYAAGSITITDTEFADNGTTTGLTHNIYIQAVGTFDITGSYITAASTGNEIQSRALVNNITGNRIVDGPTATASYSINLPNGGVDIVSGNSIEQGPHSENPAIISFGAVGSVYPGSSLTISGNTILNDEQNAGVSAITNDSTITTVNFTDNSVWGLTSAQIANGPGPTDVSGTTFLTTEPTISDAPPFVACFCAGTLIATPDGEVPVERLAVGDLVLTRTAAARPIVWIGVGRVPAIPGRRNAATPVILRKGALADNVPHHDLRVTKGHSFYLDTVLIPVEFLVNHRSILWDDRARDVGIYHIELETHDVLMAQGAPAESYRDDGNRWLFRNASSGWNLPPQEACAPVLTGGPIVDAVWRRLLDRAGPRIPVPTTDQPDLHLLVDGRRVDGRRRRNGVHVFRLPAAPREVRVVSRAGVPAELGLARDPRVLGVAVRRAMLWRGASVRIIEASDPALGDGFHPFEAQNGLRWTNGDGQLPAAMFAGIDGPGLLELHIGSTTRYPLLGEPLRMAAA
ncbi:MAG TPA: Hint domain-containing protein [Acetobacteraceae bacterium]